MKVILLILLFAATTLSCRKSYTITGRVYNAETGIGLPDSKIYFTPKLKNGKANGSVELITDENGYYSYEGSVNINNAQRILFNDFQTKEYLILKPYERTLMTGLKENTEDLAFLRIAKTYIYFEDRDSSTWQYTKEVHIKFSSPHSAQFYPTILSNVNSFSGKTSTSSLNFNLLEGWNYISGYALIQGSYRYFSTSVYVDAESVNPIIKKVFI